MHTWHRSTKLPSEQRESPAGFNNYFMDQSNNKQHTTSTLDPRVKPVYCILERISESLVLKYRSDKLASRNILTSLSNSGTISDDRERCYNLNLNAGQVSSKVIRIIQLNCDNSQKVNCELQELYAQNKFDLMALQEPYSTFERL